MSKSLLELQKKKLQLYENKKRFESELPHLYGFKWYNWARKFFESSNRQNLLCAANQISKSSTQIRKAIHWATDESLWPSLWASPPRQFWYLYPSQDVATIEFYKKWVPEFMPRGESKVKGAYSWDEDLVRRQVKAIHFKETGVSIYFKSYMQDVQNLQTGTCHAIFCDEEMPEELYDELMLRLAASKGHFHMVFTATLNQDFWRRAIEPSNKETENLPDAFKQQVSMYDCLQYEDGSKTPWTVEEIQAIERRCRNEAERQRRVYGRFITEEGRIYHSFNASKHFIKPRPIPPNWHYYSGVDIGSGGTDNHPAAIAFIAVRPDFQFGYVCIGWRGDGIITTNGDIIDKHEELRGRRNCTLQSYDGAAKDFGTISGRRGLSFIKADKAHDLGEDIINDLFRNDMLYVFDTNELRKLGGELSSLMKSTAVNKRKDDLADALRYAAVSIPWDFSVANGVEEEKVPQKRVMTEKEIIADEITRRRAMFFDPREKQDEWGEHDEEINFWNDQYG